jgi:hypothetical protein
MAATLTLGLGAAGQTNELRALYVATTDPAGKPREHVPLDAFHVWEGDVAREVTTAAPATEPPAVVVIAHGLTREDGTQDIRRALGALVEAFRQARPDTRMALVTEVRTPHLVNITENAAELDKTASRFAMSGTNLILFEAITDACRALSKEASRRRIIMVITSSLKNDSSQSAEQAVATLRNAGASLWTIDVASGSNRANLNGGMSYEKDSLLSGWTSASGGYNDQIFGATGLSASVTRMASVVLSQYLVTYPRPAGDASRAVRVGVAGSAGEHVFASTWSVK